MALVASYSTQNAAAPQNAAVRLTRCLAACFALVLLLVAEPSFARQTGTVRGFVTDSTRAAPLQGASVGLIGQDGRSIGTATDADGYFSLPRVPVGQYTMRVSFVGFATVSSEIAVGAGDVIVRRFSLAEDETVIGELVVEAEREGGAATVRAGLQSVTPAEIARVPVPGVTGDVSAYLQSLPGVVSQGDRGGQVYLRGGAVDQSLALLDGLPVYLPFHVLSFFSAFPEGIVDRVDLYSAGFGAEHGSRVSSVVDVHSRNGSKQRLSGSVALAPFMSGAQLEGPLITDHVSVIASARRSLVSELTPNILGQKFPYRFGDFFGKVHAVAGRGHALSVTALTTFDRGDIAGTQKTFDGTVIPDAGIDSNEVSWNNTLIGGRYQFAAPRLPVTLQIGGGISRMDNEVGPPDEASRKASIESVDAYADAVYEAGSMSVSVGGRYRTSELAYELGGRFQDFVMASSTVDELMSHVSLNVRASNFTIEPSVQLYAVDGYDTQVDPRVRLGWEHDWPVPITANVAAGRYHQAVAGLTDERDIGSVFTAWVPASGALQSSTHLVGGFSVVPNRWLSIAAEAYVKQFTDLTVPIFSAFPGFTTTLQSADGMARGFDVRLALSDYPLDENWSAGGHITYAYGIVEYETDDVTYNPPHDRRQQGNLVLQASRNEYTVSVQSQYGTGLPFNESAGFDTFILFTPDVDLSSEPGLERIAYGEPFRGRLPVYARTDVWLEKRVDRGRNRLLVRAGAVNIFNRANLFYFDLFTFRRVDQLPFIPSVGVKLELR